MIILKKPSPLVQEKLDTIQNYIEQHCSSENGLKDYLMKSLNLSSYSLNNQLLIMYQNRDAIAVASKFNWKKKGIIVNDDARPISILKPFFTKYYLDGEKWKCLYYADEETKKRVEREKVKTKQVLSTFSVAQVYDISDTDATQEKIDEYVHKKKKISLDEENYKTVVSWFENELNEMPTLGADLPQNVLKLAETYVDEAINETMELDLQEINLLHESSKFVVASLLGFDEGMAFNTSYQFARSTTDKEKYRKVFGYISNLTNGLVNGLVDAFY